MLEDDDARGLTTPERFNPSAAPVLEEEIPPRLETGTSLVLEEELPGFVRLPPPKPLSHRGTPRALLAVFSNVLEREGGPAVGPQALPRL